MRKNLVHSTVLSLIASLVILSCAEAAQHCDNWMVKVVSVQGAVQARKSKTTGWSAVEPDDTYCQGDSVRVGERGRAALLFQNESVLRLDQNTTITLVSEEREGTSIVELLKGVVLFFVRTPSGFQVITPFVNGNVEGTEFLVQVDESSAVFTVFEGRVSAANEAGSLSIDKNGSAVARAGKAPVQRTVLRPRDAVQWALYYPQIPGEMFSEGPGAEEDWQNKAGQSQRLFSRGDLAAAFDSIAGIDTQRIPDPRFFTYRAFLDLAAGRYDSAASDLDRALELNPADSYAYALKAAMAVARNSRDDALKLAARAVELDPRSSSALIALSYAQQASFNLEGARASLEKAVEANPLDALAWARLAEVRLSFGYLDSALDAAARAVEIDPRQSRTQTVLGYAYLTQIDTAKANKAFRKAIALDQADPLPRLGLGLALIRDGDLKAGRIEIEIAAVLDPDNSLIRSYLGKAYYEGKLEKKAAIEFSLAKELDPLDPTPWLYDAMLKQSLNRPAEALQDLQRSIELNGNRAVYRSRLLLDQDIAMRSAELAHIYDNLGFARLSLVEGLKSLNTDPANYSAHRFLADFYASLPRHELARVSETLQSKLLQPININPLRPQLSETRLFMIDGTTPGNPGFNEYDALFTRDRFALLHSGLGGENGTLSDEVVQSAVIGKASYSLGQFHYQTDGFRPNDDLRNDIYDGFGQIALNARTSVQAEYTNTSTSSGDLGTRFDPANFDPTQRNRFDAEEERFGFHHQFTPNSELIGSYIHSELGRGIVVPLFFENSSDIEGNLGEIQHLYRCERFRLVAGAGYLRQDLSSRFSFLPGPASPETNTPATNADLYVYSLINFPENVTWTIGGSADFYDEQGVKSENEFNPKLGVTWNPFPSTTIRAAGFRTFQRPELTGETIEPTQVAGFNQLFADARVARAKSWREGVGIDQKFTDTLFGGIEFSRRNVDIPFFGASQTNESLASWEERIVRTYLYWTCHPRLTTTLEFQYEDLDHGKFTNYDFLEFFRKITTYRVPFGFNFFDPSGFMAKVRPTFVHQEGQFISQNGAFSSQQDTFVFLDASIGWLLPKRLGIVSLEARNLFDQSFRFQDTDPSNPTISPGRVVFLRYTLAF